MTQHEKARCIFFAIYWDEFGTLPSDEAMDTAEVLVDEPQDPQDFAENNPELELSAGEIDCLRRGQEYL